MFKKKYLSPVAELLLPDETNIIATSGEGGTTPPGGGGGSVVLPTGPEGEKTPIGGPTLPIG